MPETHALSFGALSVIILVMMAWVCFCDNPRQARVPLVVLTLAIITAQLIGRL